MMDPRSQLGRANMPRSGRWCDGQRAGVRWTEVDGFERYQRATFLGLSGELEEQRKEV